MAVRRVYEIVFRQIVPNEAGFVAPEISNSKKSKDDETVEENQKLDQTVVSSYRLEDQEYREAMPLPRSKFKRLMTSVERETDKINVI